MKGHYYDYAKRFDGWSFSCHFGFTIGEVGVVPATFKHHTAYDGAASFDVICPYKHLLKDQPDRAPLTVAISCEGCVKPWPIQVSRRRTGSGVSVTDGGAGDTRVAKDLTLSLPNVSHQGRPPLLATSLCPGG